MQDLVACLTCGAHWDQAQRACCGTCGGSRSARVPPSLADIEAAIARTQIRLEYLHAMKMQLELVARRARTAEAMH